MITVDEIVESGKCPCEVCSSQDEKRELNGAGDTNDTSDTDLDIPTNKIYPCRTPPYATKGWVLTLHSSPYLLLTVPLSLGSSIPEGDPRENILK